MFPFVYFVLTRDRFWLSKLKQKYRSHRKHMLAREVEAATWTTHRRPMYAAPSGAVKRPDSNAWTVPTIGFPPPAGTPPRPVQHFGRPLHVWGHPSPTPAVESPRVPMWPRHLAPRAPPPPPWAPPPPADPASFWHHAYMRVCMHCTHGLPAGKSTC